MAYGLSYPYPLFQSHKPLYSSNLLETRSHISWADLNPLSSQTLLPLSHWILSIKHHDRQVWWHTPLKSQTNQFEFQARQNYRGTPALKEQKQTKKYHDQLRMERNRLTSTLPELPPVQKLLFQINFNVNMFSAGVLLGGKAFAEHVQSPDQFQSNQKIPFSLLQNLHNIKMGTKNYSNLLICPSD